MLEIDLRNYLLQHSEITDMVSTRIYPGWIPKNAIMPSIAYTGVSNPAHHDINVAFPRIQFSVFSDRYLEAKKISQLLKKKLNRFKGKLGDTKIVQIVYQNQYEMYENDTGIYHIANDFKIIHWE